MQSESRSSSHRPARRPDFFLVGAPKCGTTALHRYLARHPEVFLPENKEINYFGTDLAYNLPYSVSPDEYADFFQPARRERRVGETSVMYLYSRSAAREIRAYNPEARILIMLRNPVETMYSHHSQLVATGDETIRDFESALAAEARRRQGRDIPRMTLIRDYLYYCEIVRFTEQVRRYFEVFGRERVHVVVFDDFVRDLAASYRETLAFLGVDPGFSTRFDVINANRSVRWEGLRDFVKQPPALLRAPLKRLLPVPLKHRLRGLLAALNARAAPRPPMSSSLRAQLNAEFRPEVERLSALLGRDLTHWCEIEDSGASATETKGREVHV